MLTGGLEESARQAADKLLLIFDIAIAQSARDHAAHIPARLDQGNAHAFLRRGNCGHGSTGGCAVNNNVKA
jgi:hypothetical protein